MTALTSGMDCILDHAVLILLSGEDNGWFTDYDAPLSSSYSDDDKVYRSHKRENESNTEFSANKFQRLWKKIFIFCSDGVRVKKQCHQTLLTLLFQPVGYSSPTGHVT